MRPASGCKLFGAYQALGGIQDGIVLLHSVVGCNFGSMSLHVAQDMRDIRQTCTVISDSDVVFSGEASLERAVRSALELFQPSVLFVVSGCVSEMIGDDIPAVLARIPHEVPLLHVEAAGFRGDAARGLEAGWLALLPLMKPPVPRPYPRPYPRSDPRPLVNLIGLGMDDPHAADDVEALRAMLAPQAALGAVLSRCTLEEVRRAPYADVNLVLRGKGRELAQAMKEYFGIPWEELDYPMAPPARTISGVGWSAASVWIIIRPGRSWTVRLQREPEKPTAIYRPSTACRLRSSPRGRGPTVCGAFWSRSWGWRWCALPAGRSSPTRRTSTGSCAAPRRRFCLAPPLSRTVPTSWKFR